MRNKLFVLIAILLLAPVLAACGSTALAQTPAPASPAPRTISVTGKGEVPLTPDIARISIGVRTEGVDVAEAMASNNAQAQEVVDALKELGVAERDIQTSNFSIYPQQQYDEQGQVIDTTFVVENTVYITVRELENLGDLLDAAVGRGANSIYGIQFDVEEKDDAISEARQAAVENASAQAEELAAAAGVSLGQIQSISAASSFPGPIFDGRGAAVEQPAADVPISPGQLIVTAEVSVVYEIQ
ncbi:MAG TPA: SIMPL domain-containing protein [Anaerolineales bacterium]